MLIFSSGGGGGGTGSQGPEGDSAYQVWLDEGNSGTEQDFLDSLVGTTGATGPQGPAGDDGSDATVNTSNVTAAGALMDSEVTNLVQVKAFDSSDYATSTQGSLADSATQPGDNISTMTNDAGYLTSYTENDTLADVTGRGAITTDAVTINNDLTVDTDTLHVDSANGNVGIGKTTPAYDLDVNGAIRSSGYIYTSNIQGLASTLTIRNTNQILFGNGGYLLQNSPNSYDIAIFTGSTPTQTMTWSADGNVGLGTASPLYKLHVDTTAEANALIIRDSDGRVGINTNSLSSALNIGGDRSITFDGGTGIVTAGSNALYLTGNIVNLNSTDVRVNGAGLGANFNVKSSSSGITPVIIRGATGQTADLLKIQDSAGASLLSLDKDGNFAVTDANGAAVTNVLKVYHDATASQGTGAGAGILFQADNTSNTKLPLGSINFVSTDAVGYHTGDFVVNTVNNVIGEGSEVFRITAAGKVGIGTTTPDTKIHNTGAYTQEPLSSDPSDPDDGNSVQWVSDGTGSGDAGDVMMKINVGGTTKTVTLIDYSTLT